MLKPLRGVSMPPDFQGSFEEPGIFAGVALRVMGNG